LHNEHYGDKQRRKRWVKKHPKRWQPGEPGGCDYPSGKRHGLESQTGWRLPGEAGKIDNVLVGKEDILPTVTVTPHHDMINTTRYM